MAEVCLWYLFHKQGKRSFSTALDIFNPLLKCSIFKCISWLNGSFFLVVNIRVFWKMESRPIEWRQYRLSTRQRLSCLHIYSLWYIGGLLKTRNDEERATAIHHRTFWSSSKEGRLSECFEQWPWQRPVVKTLTKGWQHGSRLLYLVPGTVHDVLISTSSMLRR
jgi:hypothetical protein